MVHHMMGKVMVGQFMGKLMVNQLMAELMVDQSATAGQLMVKQRLTYGRKL